MNRKHAWFGSVFVAVVSGLSAQAAEEGERWSNLDGVTALFARTCLIGDGSAVAQKAQVEAFDRMAMTAIAFAA